MKKLIYGTLFLTLVGIGFVGCKKETIKTSSESSQKESGFLSKTGSSFRSDGRMLIFNTSTDFENFIEFDFTNYASSLSDNNKDNQLTIRNIKNELASQNYVRYSDFIINSSQEDLIADVYLNEILNADRIVQIGAFLYMIDKAVEKVFVLSSTHISDYNDLVTSNTSNKRIKVYGTDEDVIEMVENGQISVKGLFCNSRNALFKSLTSQNFTINSFASANATARYKQYGLSFKLEADVLIYNTNANSNLKVYIAMDNCRYKQRCGTVLNNFSHPWLSTQIQQIGSFHKIYRYTLYNSVKRLENYTFKIRSRVEDWLNPIPSQPYTTIFSDWVTISDY